VDYTSFIKEIIYLIIPLYIYNLNSSVSQQRNIDTYYRSKGLSVNRKD